MSPDTTSQTFFEQKYRQSKDPWKFAESRYELGRYGAIVCALSKRRYHRAFEPGCSIGVLTARLASLCEHVLATDISPTAVALARERCSTLLNVDIRCEPLDERSLDQFIRRKEIDLLVLSEIGYYFHPARWRILAKHLAESVVPGGTVVAAHWLGESQDHLQHGDSVHEILRSIASIALEYSERCAEFRLDLWRKQ